MSKTECRYVRHSLEQSLPLFQEQTRSGLSQLDTRHSPSTLTSYT